MGDFRCKLIGFSKQGLSGGNVAAGGGKPGQCIECRDLDVPSDVRDRQDRLQLCVVVAARGKQAAREGEVSTPRERLPAIVLLE